MSIPLPKGRAIVNIRDKWHEIKIRNKGQEANNKDQGLRKVYIISK
jgi:hypothetical protein